MLLAAVESSRASTSRPDMIQMAVVNDLGEYWTIEEIDYSLPVVRIGLADGRVVHANP